MSTKTNDPVVSVTRLADAVTTSEDNTAVTIGRVAYAIRQLLGDTERLGAPVVPMLQWAKSPEATNAVSERIAMLSECDTDAIKQAVKAAKSAADAVKLRSKLESRNRAIKRGMMLLGACAILTDRVGVEAEWTENGLRYPAAWFVPEGYTILQTGKNGHRMHGLERTAAKAVLRATRDDQDGGENDGEIHDLKFSPTVQGIIDVAYGKTKRQARPEGNKPEAEASEDGEAKPVTPASARDILAKEASRDDYKMAPTGEIKEDWQIFFDDVATNPHFRAMMVRAIARANKAEAEQAASKAA